MLFVPENLDKGVIATQKEKSSRGIANDDACSVLLCWFAMQARLWLVSISSCIYIRFCGL